jgi:hypothetical protein
VKPFGPALLLLLVATVAISAVGCHLKCQKLSDCSKGEFCDPSTQQCLKGCQSDSDCGPNDRCNLDYGYCWPAMVPHLPDAAPSDGTQTSTATDGSRTSTRSDAGAALG